MSRRKCKTHNSLPHHTSSKIKAAPMSTQPSPNGTPLKYPASDDRKGWKTYWAIQKQPWRTEPEIDEKRQRFLTKRRATTPDIEQGIYPFKGIKLDRADVEWLLATHENGRGPVDWNDKSQRDREGLDLRGAELRHVNLQALPLAYMRGGLYELEWYETTKEQSAAAAVLMNGANLKEAHLEQASLRRAHLEDASLWKAHLEQADLTSAHLEGTYIYYAYLGGASLRLAFFDAATYLRGSSLGDKELGFVSLADVRWNSINLAVVNWSQISMLGEEQKAKKKDYQRGKVKDRNTRIEEYRKAVRANRQLAVELQVQGLTEDSARFAYHAQILQKHVLWFQMLQPRIPFWQRLRTLGAWVFSHVLNLLTGYGYRPGRSFLAYGLVIGIFMITYYLLGTIYGPPLHWREAFVVSMTAFHGRGFFPNQFKPSDPQALAAAIEALIGLLIEATFIGTLTQRLFNK